MKQGRYVITLAFLLVFATTSAFGYYNPETGRFLSRDPVGELGFQTTQIAATGRTFQRPSADKNAYHFVDNDPIGSIDILGLWKPTFKSRGKARRVYVWEPGDTKESLAKEVRLEINEFDKWAKLVDHRRGSGEMACAYSIPNTAYVWIGYWSFDEPGDVRAMPKEILIAQMQAKTWRIGLGLKVDFNMEPSWKEAMDAFKDEDTIGVSYWGHGGGMYLKKDGAPPGNIIEQQYEFFGGRITFDASYAIMHPKEARPALHHGLRFYLHQGCYGFTHQGGGWRSLVTKLGTFGGHRGTVEGAFAEADVETTTGTYSPE